MAQNAIDSQRLDPYKDFFLRLRDGNRTYFGSKRTGLIPPSEVVKHRAGGDPSTSYKSPGRNKYDAITLNRGVTHDPPFSNWASKVWNFGSGLGSEVSLAYFRKDIYLEFYNEAGQSVVGYRIFGTSVFEAQALPPGGVVLHFLQPRGPTSIQEQLEVIFQNSLKRLRP
ncbi:MAG: phage tail protein [Terriglobia bacterium]|jgi:phage tail-like protein